MGNKNLVACRSHFFVVYLAFAEIAKHASNSDFGHTNLDIFTAFDGGGGPQGYNPPEDKMWHFWGVLEEDGHTLTWTCMSNDIFYKFELVIESIDHSKWPGVSFEKLQELMFEKLYETKPAKTHGISPKAIKKAKQIEKRFFANFGQGDDVLHH